MQDQPPEGEPVPAEIGLLDAPGLGAVDFEKFGDEVAEMGVDMGQQPVGHRIERVVEIEHPRLDPLKTVILHHSGWIPRGPGHGPKMARRDAAGKGLGLAWTTNR